MANILQNSLPFNVLRYRNVCKCNVCNIRRCNLVVECVQNVHHCGRTSAIRGASLHFCVHGNRRVFHAMLMYLRNVYPRDVLHSAVFAVVQCLFVVRRYCVYTDKPIVKRFRPRCRLQLLSPPGQILHHVRRFFGHSPTHLLKCYICSMPKV